MRLIIDSLVALMLVGVLAGMALHHRREKDMDQRIELTHSETQRFHSQIMLQAAMEKTQLTQRGYPATVEPEWFGENLPRNPLLPEGHAWVEVAGDSQRDLEHPPKRIATGREMAQFWYNPHSGVVRARVPADVSDATALRLYNYINDTKLDSIFAREQ